MNMKQNNLNDLIEFCKGKSIALVGNAESIFDKKRNIDDFDVVIRMNRGVQLTSEQINKIGRKCDVYGCSGAGLATQATLNAPQFKMWMTTFFREKAPEDFLFYPEEQWDILKEKLGDDTRPSTGLMMLDFLVNNIDFKSINLFGFDGWQTKTWYMHRLHVAATHVPSKETSIIETLLKENKNIRIIK